MASKRDQKGKRPLLRPIICICNDQNAHALAKLRPHARQIRFTRPADIHVVKRLKDVCEVEGLKADSRALSTLVGVSRGDLRGCLNALQVGQYVFREQCLNYGKIVYQGPKWRSHRVNHACCHSWHEGSRLINDKCSQ